MSSLYRLLLNVNNMQKIASDFRNVNLIMLIRSNLWQELTSHLCQTL